MTSLTTSAALRIGAAILSVGAILLSPLLIAPQASNAAVSAVKLIDNFNRQAVIDAYEAQLKSQLLVTTGWTGDTSKCIPGSSSTANKAASLKAVNYMRAMADLPPVRLNATLSKYGQAGALISEANGWLTHNPYPGMRCYSKNGYLGTSRGNLHLHRTGDPRELNQGTGPRAIVGYMVDYGDDNKEVGHRRWVLYPRLTEVGLGDTDYANNMVVLGGKFTSPKSQWVTWPTAGYFPRELEPDGRWSISYANANFKNASISVKTPDGQATNVKRTIKNGYGDNTLAWDMKLPAGYSTSTSDYEVLVTVANIQIGKKIFSRSYKVTLVDADPEHEKSLDQKYLEIPVVTAGYIRPQIKFRSADSCVAIEGGWRVTTSFNLSNGNFFSQYREHDTWQRKTSGLKKPNETWVFRSHSDIITEQPPTGVHVLQTFDAVEFTSMNGGPAEIDVVWLEEDNAADLTGLCK